MTTDPAALGDLVDTFGEATAPAARAPWATDRIGVQREPLPPGMRRAVLIRDSFTCRLCATTARGNGVILEIDHIVPWSAGGADHPVNLRTLCRPCNQDRSNRITGFERRALLITFRCRRCETGNINGASYVDGYCLTCRDDGAVPYLADLILGGPIPAVGVLPGDELDPAIAYRPGVEHGIEQLRIRVEALVVHCPWCLAPPGEPCIGRDGYPLTRSPAHPARIEAAS